MFVSEYVCFSLQHSAIIEWSEFTHQIIHVRHEGILTGNCVRVMNSMVKNYTNIKVFENIFGRVVKPTYWKVFSFQPLTCLSTLETLLSFSPESACGLPLGRQVQ